MKYGSRETNNGSGSTIRSASPLDGQVAAKTYVADTQDVVVIEGEPLRQYMLGLNVVSGSRQGR